MWPFKTFVAQLVLDLMNIQIKQMIVMSKEFHFIQRHNSCSWFRLMLTVKYHDYAVGSLPRDRMLSVDLV